MKKMKILALLIGAMLFTGFGAVSLSAADMKCGAGKCGQSMGMAAPCKDCKNMPADCKCNDKGACTCKDKSCTCFKEKKAGKCNTGKANTEPAAKCNSGKADPQPAAKCNSGKE